MPRASSPRYASPAASPPPTGPKLIVDRVNYQASLVDLDIAIAAFRGFSRFYTQLVGALEPRFLESDLSLAEARLLFEIAQAEQPVAADLQAALGFDAGYVSRILRRFEADGLIERERDAADSRRRPIALTSKGRAAFDALDSRQRDKVAEMLQPLAPSARTDLVAALGTARVLLGAPQPAFSIRTFRTGDVGLVAARQSILYTEVYGWGRGIEINIGAAATAFLRDFKPGREQCWIAEVGGVMAGSVFLTDEGDGLCRLRLLYVEPFTRGLGVGKALVRTCLAFARETRYTQMMLWTHTILETARCIYAAEGFELTETEMHEEFGTPIQGEIWRLELGSA